MLTFSIMGYSRESLTVGWEHYPPNQWQDANGNLHGLDIEVVKAVLETAGFDVIFKKMPWKRLLKVGLRNGDIDIALNAGMTEERKAYSHYSSIAYFPADSAMFIRQQDQLKFKNITQLKDIIEEDITVGVTLGSIYSKEYEQLLHNPNFTKKLYPSAKESQIIDMLLAGRIDAMLGGHISIFEILKQRQTTNNIILHSYLSHQQKNSGSFFMLSKNSVTTLQLQRVNQALEQLHNNGALKKITAPYLFTRDQ